MTYIKILGDVSSGTGKDLGELAIIFGQIASTGRLMGQDLLQLINAGFNPLQVISKNTGRSMKDLKKDMESGLISFAMVEQAFKDATSAGGLFFNSTINQSKTVSGMLSTIEGNIEEIAKGLFNGQSDAITQVSKALVLLTSNTEAFVKVIDNAVKVNGIYWIVKGFLALAESIEKSTAETKRLRKETVLLELANLRISLNSGLSADFETRKRIITQIQTLSKEIEQMPKGTTEDPLPWANTKKADDIIKVVKANEKARAEFFKMMGFTSGLDKFKAKQEESDKLQKIEDDANQRSLTNQEYFEELRRKKQRENEEYRWTQAEEAVERSREQFNKIASAALEASNIVGSAISDAFSGAFSGVQVLAKATSEIVNLFAKQAIAAAIANAAKAGGPFPFAAVALATVAAGAMTGLLSRFGLKTSGGGGGGSSSFSYPSRPSTNEGFQNFALTTNVSGTDLNIVMANTNNRNKFTRP